jgi:AraC-like DNA-binding protein
MARSHDRASQIHAPPSADAPVGARAATHAPRTDPSSVGARRIDPLSDVLQKVRLTGALFFMIEATEPWGVDVPHKDSFSAIVLPGAQHIVSYDVILEGAGWVCMPGVEPTRFEAGDVLVFPHGDPYRLLSAPDQVPEFDTDATIAFLREMAAGRLPFVTREGGGGLELTRYICGYLGCDARPFNPLLSALPPLLHLRRSGGARAELLDRLVALTLDVDRTGMAGGESIRLRLSELMFVEAIRRHLEKLPASQTGWLAGLRDRVVGRALVLLHEQPTRTWTVDELARSIGVSRAVLAERFSELVGCPPIQYLTQWRMQLAARLLADNDSTVSVTAHEVGYESEAAFSRAFKRLSGVSPAEWRRSR